MKPRLAHEIRVIEKPEFGQCSCGGRVMYHDDGGVRCIECRKLYGVHVADFRKKAGATKPPERVETPMGLV